MLSKGINIYFNWGLSENEVKRLVDTINESDNKSSFGKLLDAYPAPLNEFDLEGLKELKKYGILSGLSDRSTNSYAALISIALGAKVIEKHVTLSETDNIADKSFSMSILEFAKYCKLIREAEESLNSDSFESQDSEQSNLILKRSIVASENIKSGDVFSKENIIVKRPNIGLEPHFYNFVLGKKANYNYEKGEGISEKELQN